MKATLQFDMNDESEDLDLALKARNYASFVDSLQNWVRAAIKYEDKDFVSFEDLRDKITELKNEADL